MALHSIHIGNYIAFCVDKNSLESKRVKKKLENASMLFHVFDGHRFQVTIVCKKNADDKKKTCILSISMGEKKNERKSIRMQLSLNYFWQM